MSLDVSKLKRVRRQGGTITAQCPACAEKGGDKSDENHLIIYADGAYGCVAHQKDKEHRRRIWALVGQRDGPLVAPPSLKPFVHVASQVEPVNTVFPGTDGTGCCKSREGKKESETNTTASSEVRTGARASQASQAVQKPPSQADIEADPLIQAALKAYQGKVLP